VTQVLLRAGAGPYVASFAEVEPPPRFAPAGGDPGAWTQLRAREAPARTGPWTLLGTVAISPVDDDPADPAPLRVTIAGVALAAGWYLLELLDGDGNTQPFAPLYNGQSWRPSVSDVAKQSRAYTNAENQFDSGTSPTAGEVEGYVDIAVQEIAGRVGLADDTISPLADLARTAATWHAAASVEGQNSQESESTQGFRWKQSSYVACLNELVGQARSGAVRLV
jgi:hypothetical protein